MYSTTDTTTDGVFVACCWCGDLIPSYLKVWTNVASKGKQFCSERCALLSYSQVDIHESLRAINEAIDQK